MTNVKELKNIDYKSLTIFFTILYGVIGFVGGIIMAFSVIVPGIISGEIGMAFLIGIMFCVLFTSLYALMGAIAGIVAAFCYNVIAKKFGGVKITFEDTPQETIKSNGDTNEEKALDSEE